jgi:hypothetical protein
LSTNTTSFVYLHRLPEFINHVLYEQEVPPIIRNGAFFITCNGGAGGESLLFNFPSFVPSLVVFLNRTILFCFCLSTETSCSGHSNNDIKLFAKDPRLKRCGSFINGSGSSSSTNGAGDGCWRCDGSKSKPGLPMQYCCEDSVGTPASSAPSRGNLAE